MGPLCGAPPERAVRKPTNGARRRYIGNPSAFNRKIHRRRGDVHHNRALADAR
jgi:hypothetical protein